MGRHWPDPFAVRDFPPLVMNRQVVRLWDVATGKEVATGRELSLTGHTVASPKAHAKHTMMALRLDASARQRRVSARDAGVSACASQRS